uniref:Uncharacterized protein n=1 Tax=Cacopsylla melanoneura TaxID=428564 RepID=A0A8D8QMQ6_9HEMI
MFINRNRPCPIYERMIRTELGIKNDADHGIIEPSGHHTAYTTHKPYNKQKVTRHTHRRDILSEEYSNINTEPRKNFLRRHSRIFIIYCIHFLMNRRDILSQEYSNINRTQKELSSETLAHLRLEPPYYVSKGSFSLVVPSF